MLINIFKVLGKLYACECCRCCHFATRKIFKSSSKYDRPNEMPSEYKNEIRFEKMVSSGFFYFDGKMIGIFQCNYFHFSSTLCGSVTELSREIKLFYFYYYRFSFIANEVYSFHRNANGMK